MLQRRLVICLMMSLFGLLVGCAAEEPRIAANQPAVTREANPQAAMLPAFKHIFVIVMENKAYETVIDSDEAPYLNALAQQYGLATNYYGITHPSLLNHLALTGGDTFGITSNCTDCSVAHPSLVDQLEAAGKSWKAYIEAMPQACFVGDAAPLYRQKHNPFIYYDAVRNDPARCKKIVPFTEFASDIRANTLPDLAWITPDMCNSTHDCPLSTGDSWLKTVVPTILASNAWKDNGLLVITFDEGSREDTSSCCEHGRGGHTVTLVISPLGKPAYRSAAAYDHYSLLRTIETAWGLPLLGNANCDCSAPMADFFMIPSSEDQSAIPSLQWGEPVNRRTEPGDASASSS